MLTLMYIGNRNTNMAVNTAVGQTDRVMVYDTVQQGGVFGPIMCSNSIDKVGKMCYERGENLYLYKQTVNVLPLAMCDDLLAMSVCGQKSLSLNSYINAEIELKKLRFHTPDKAGKTKCHKMHIGKPSKTCPKLQVHSTAMKEVKEDTYLGDIISADGKNESNIKNRIGKGLGKINDIMTMLEKVTLGEHYFSTAMVLRESSFLNSVLGSAECWYNFNKEDIKQLESLDLSLLRQILNAPISVPKESLYLELGILNIETILKARRLNYLHYLVTRNPEEMLFKFFMRQWKHPVAGDWTLQAKQDLEDFSISEDLDMIKSQSKYSFKTLVKRKAKEFALFTYLEKKASHTKLDNLFYPDLTMQEYLKLNTMTLYEAKTVFSYRVRAANYSDNYRGPTGLMPCPLCHLHLDCQPLAFQCPEIKQNIKVTENYTDIFKTSVDKSLAALLVKIDKFREETISTKQIL